VTDILDLPLIIDTNVVFEGLTKKGGAADLIVRAWLAGALTVCVSNALAYEYESTLSNKLSATRWVETKPILGKMLTLVKFVPVNYVWRPSSPDPGDEHVIDCAMNANGVVITGNKRDFRMAERELGLQVISPVEFVNEVLKE
jgi:predicted nucleic acid-binding protein